MSNAAGRNDPCPCGSGKKYKKCCLPTGKYEILRELEASAARAAAVEAKEKAAGMVAIPAEGSAIPKDSFYDEEEVSLPVETEWPELNIQRVDSQFPEPTAEVKLFVEAWWKVNLPLFRKLSSNAKLFLLHIHECLDQHPTFFQHLHVEEDVLFELGAELHRQGQADQYIQLLLRLRREQLKTYEQIFSYLDLDLIEVCLIRSNRQDIPLYLDLYKKYPDNGPDQCAELVRLLAWNNAVDAMHELVSSCAIVWYSSPEIIAGYFGLDWLRLHEFYRFLDARDESEEAGNKLHAALLALNIPNYTEFSTAELTLILKQTLLPDQPPDLQAHRLEANTYTRHLGHCFWGYLHDRKGLGWMAARFLADQLEHYWNWDRHLKNKAHSCFRLNRQEMEPYLSACCKIMFWIKGTLLLSALQSFVFFADYLLAQGRINPAENDRIKTDCAALFELGRKAVDATDPAYQLYPTFAALCAAEPAKHANLRE